MLSNILNIYCKNIFNNFLIAESCRTRTHLFQKLPSLAPAPAPAPESRNAPVLHSIQHSQRSDNRFADALATLGARISFEGIAIEVTIIKKPIPAIQVLKEEFFGWPLDQADWRSPVKEVLSSPSSKEQLKCFKDYTLVVGELYRKFPGGVLARCLSLGESCKRLREVHEKSYGSSGTVSLYRRL